MNPAAEIYRMSGLKGLTELYQQFPTKFRSQIITSHARLWKEFWSRLTPEEKKEFDEYSLVEEPLHTASEVSEYETKLDDLQKHYTQRHAQRVKEASSLSPEDALKDIESFEQAHRTLVKMTTELLVSAQTRLKEQELREQEMSLFA